MSLEWDRDKYLYMVGKKGLAVMPLRGEWEDVPRVLWSCQKETVSLSCPSFPGGALLGPSKIHILWKGLPDGTTANAPLIGLDRLFCCCCS